MGFNILKFDRSNILIYALMTFQMVVLIGIGIILISAVSNISLITAASSTIVFFIGLPMLILIYASNTDKTLKTVFFGLTANMAFLSTSGIIWYILSGSLGFGWLVPVAKVIMVIGYVPLIYTLYIVYKNKHKKLDRNAKIFIGFVNISCSFAIIYFTLTRLSTGNSFDIIIYTLSTLGDIIILALLAMLIMIYPQMRLRYIFSNVFCFTLMSLAGDGLSLIDAMKVESYSLALYSNYFYDSMLLFIVVMLFIYLFFREFDETTVEEVNKKLGDTQHAMDDLVIQMPDATCIFDPAGMAIMVNGPFLRIFGVKREDVIGKFNLFRHSEFLKCEMRDKSLLLKKGDTVAIDRVKIVFPGNRTAYLSFKIFPTFSQDGDISSFIAIAEDVTDRFNEEIELVHARALAELYIDLMGHDINNMNQVGMGYLEIALNTLKLDDENKKLLVKPLEAMENSSRLIDNVKKLRRASAGDLRLSEMDLGRVLKDVIREHGQAPGRDIAVDYRVIENTTVNANELLSDVFANLLNNAIKHSRGPLQLNVRQAIAEIDGKKYYRVVVEDNGPGIPDDLKPILFDRIFRSRNKVGGNGIGLYLVKTLVDGYGGTISVEDRVPGERENGTRFIVTLPAAEKAAENAVEPPASAPKAAEKTGGAELL